jgi:hypothetical protein
MIILGPIEFHGRLDTWNEYLCMERLEDGRLELSSRRRVLLGYENSWFGEVVWPEGHDPDQNEGDILPVTVDGTAVWGRDGSGIVGHELVSYGDEAVRVFRLGESEDARVWLGDYGWARAANFEAAMEMIKAALSKSRTSMV